MLHKLRAPKLRVESDPTKAHVAEAGKHLSREAVAAYRRVFDAVDVNSDGGLELHELSAHIKEKGTAVDARDACAIFAEFDLNGDGIVDFPEFLTLMRRFPPLAVARFDPEATDPPGGDVSAVILPGMAWWTGLVEAEHMRAKMPKKKPVPALSLAGDGAGDKALRRLSGHILLQHANSVKAGAAAEKEGSDQGSARSSARSSDKGSARRRGRRDSGHKKTGKKKGPEPSEEASELSAKISALFRSQSPTPSVGSDAGKSDASARSGAAEKRPGSRQKRSSKDGRAAALNSGRKRANSDKGPGGGALAAVKAAQRASSASSLASGRRSSKKKARGSRKKRRGSSDAGSDADGDQSSSEDDGGDSTDDDRLSVESATGREKGAKFPKAALSTVSHSFRLMFGRAIIPRSALEARMLVLARARADQSRC